MNYAEATDGAPKAPRLFGRGPEIANLTSALDSVVHSQKGSVLLLAGDSGAGKTALAEWCLATASESHGYVFARATCEPFQAGMSMFPILEIVWRLCGREQSVSDLVGGVFGNSSNERAVAVAAFDNEADPSFRREYMMATFANVVVAASKELDRPVILFVDDLERIDTASVDAITVLISRIAEAPLLLLGAFRSDLVAADRSHVLKTVVDRCRSGDNRFQLLEVQPLKEEFTRPLVEDYFSNHVEVSDRFVDHLYRETEGNPLFIREVLRGIADRRGSGGEQVLPTNQGGAFKLEGSTEFLIIPKSIEDAIATRLNPLTEREIEVLESASVIGRRFRYEILEESCGLTSDAKLETLERLVDLDLLREVPNSEDEFEFAHGKVREVVLNRMTGLRRSRLHAKVAEVMSTRRALFSAEQWEAAMGIHLLAARKYEAAVPFLLDAGKTSLSFAAGADAASYFKDCLEAIERSSEVDVTMLADVRLLYGEALKNSSQIDAAIRELQVVANSSDSLPAQRWALNHLGDISRMRDQITDAFELYAMCESLATSSNDEDLLVEVAADLAELHMRQYERLAGIDPGKSLEHRGFYETYLKLESDYVGKSTRKGAQARSLRNRAKFERVNGDPDRAISLYEEALNLIDTRVASHEFMVPYAKALRLVGRDEDAMNQVLAVLDWSRQIGAPRSEAIARQYLGLLLVERAITEEDTQRANTFLKAKGELEIALKLHDEANFRQGYRETVVNLLELAVLEGHQENARIFLRMTDDYSGQPKVISEAQMCEAVLLQLRGNGENVRADRLETGLMDLGLARDTDIS